MEHTHSNGPRELSIGQQDQLARVEHSGQLNKPDIPSSQVEHFVGDLVQLFPVEIIDMIFAYCEPVDIFKLRSVSSAWNNYLSKSYLLQDMNFKIYRINIADGQNLLKSEKAETERRRTYRLENRCALIDGRACSLTYIQLPRALQFIQFSSGTFIGLSDTTYGRNSLFVKRLHRDDKDWVILEPAEPQTTWRRVKLTSKHILACTDDGQVYCWSPVTLELLAHFSLKDEMLAESIDVPSDTIMNRLHMMDASSNTIVMVVDWRDWYLYSLDTKKFAVVNNDKLCPYGCRLEQSGYLYIYSGKYLDTEQYIDVFKIDDTSTSIDFVSRINLSALGWQKLEAIASDYDVGMVGSSGCRFDSFTNLRLQPQMLLLIRTYQWRDQTLPRLRNGRWHHDIPSFDTSRERPA